MFSSKNILECASSTRFILSLSEIYLVRSLRTVLSFSNSIRHFGCRNTALEYVMPHPR